MKPDWGTHIRNIEAATDRLPNEALGELVWLLRHKPEKDKGYSNFQDAGSYCVVWDKSGHGHKLPARDRCPDVSLDAADELVAELTPESPRQSNRFPSSGYCTCHIGNAFSGGVSYGEAKTEPLAILTALCRAMKAQQEAGE